LSPLFGTAFATVTAATVELYNTDGSQGAARGAGVGAGIYKDFTEAFSGLRKIKTIEPDPNLEGQYSVQPLGQCAGSKTCNCQPDLNQRPSPQRNRPCYPFT